LMFV